MQSLLPLHILLISTMAASLAKQAQPQPVEPRMSRDSNRIVNEGDGVIIKEIHGRKMIEVIEKVHRDSADCKLAKQLNDLPRLDIHFREANYTDQVKVAVRTANILSDLLPSGSGRRIYNTTDGQSILEANAEVLFSLVRSNLESDPRLLGCGIVFDTSVYRNFTYFAPYAFRDTHDKTIRVKDLSTTWSVMHPVWLEYVHNISREKDFQRKTSLFIARYNKSSDGAVSKVTHPFATPEDGLWTQPYFDCGASKAWQITYTAPFIGSFTGTGEDVFM